MIMAPSLRKIVLILHVTASVGWIGTVVAYLALVIAAMTSQEAQTLRSTWIAMNLIGWFTIVPLSLVALLTGIVISLGTKWGLFQHYWVVISLALTLFATVILIQHMQSVTVFADIAVGTDATEDGMLRGGLQSELLHAGIGLLILLITQVLNVYKPRGLTPHGWRKQQEQRTQRQTVSAI